MEMLLSMTLPATKLHISLRVMFMDTLLRHMAVNGRKLCVLLVKSQLAVTLLRLLLAINISVIAMIVFLFLLLNIIVF